MNPASEEFSIVLHGLKCKGCNEVVVSLHRHDLRVCGCGKLAIDGGLDYQKVCYDIDSPGTEPVKIRVSKDCLPETPPSF